LLRKILDGLANLQLEFALKEVEEHCEDKSIEAEGIQVVLDERVADVTLHVL
jgi:hypothetical protein